MGEIWKVKRKQKRNLHIATFLVLCSALNGVLVIKIGLPGWGHQRGSDLKSGLRSAVCGLRSAVCGRRSKVEDRKSRGWRRHID